VARAVRAAIGPNKALIVKLNTSDGFAGGVSPSDVDITVAALCNEPGLVDAIVPSAGFVSKNGFYMLRGIVPRSSMVRALARSSWLKAGALALLGRWLVPELTFTPGFLLEGARRVVAQVAAASGTSGNGPLVFALGGFVDAGAVEGALAEGFAGVQMARALIREPNLVKRWEAEFSAATATAATAGCGATDIIASAVKPSPCSHCNACVVAALEGAKASPRCVERDPPQW
jgi:2,4-dienoyl-CoA reductase-like NADH-dependent reductase (Old Yellow Enzyme family)